MANQAVTMIPRVEPTFIQFKPGDLLEGVLVNIQKQDVNGKSTLKFTVERGDERFAFLGTRQLNEGLRPTDLGHAVQIRYIGENTSVVRNGNAMRVFEIAVSREKIQVGDLLITDDDIGF
jgi:hypothetical protein